jgi:hypothetical protein
MPNRGDKEKNGAVIRKEPEQKKNKKGTSSTAISITTTPECGCTRLHTQGDNT